MGKRDMHASHSVLIENASYALLYAQFFIKRAQCRTKKGVPKVWQHQRIAIGSANQSSQMHGPRVHAILKKTKGAPFYAAASKVTTCGSTKIL